MSQTFKTLGRVSYPYLGHYNMAKHGVRVFSNNLRLENPNLKVVTIEPVPYRTEIINYEQVVRMRNRYYEETPGDIKEAYDPTRLMMVDMAWTLKDCTTRTNIDEVVDAMVSGVCLHEPKLFYRCCSYFGVLYLFGMGILPEVIPDFVYCKVIFNTFSLKLVELYYRFFCDDVRGKNKAE